MFLCALVIHHKSPWNEKQCTFIMEIHKNEEITSI